MDAISIVLADDHHVVRQALRRLLEAEPGFRVLGEAADGLSAIELVRAQQPDVLVLDLILPGLNGLEVTRQVNIYAPHTRVLVLSMYADESYVAEALLHGAAGYTVKGATANELMGAIREVSAGGRYLKVPCSETQIARLLEHVKGEAGDPYDSLSTREREMLQLVAEGRTSAEIARLLFISRRTVEVHRATMMHKLELHNQTQLVRYSIARGIVPLEPDLAWPDGMGEWHRDAMIDKDVPATDRLAGRARFRRRSIAPGQ